MRPNISSMKSSRKLKYLTSLVLAVILFLVFVFVDKYFSVTNITVDSPDNAGMIFGLEDYRHSNLVLLSTDEMAKTLKKQNPEVKEVSVVKVYPQTVIVKISLYKPLAAVDNGDGYLYLSDDGRILNRSSKNSLSLPVIHYYQKLNQYLFVVGDWINFQDMNFALHFIKTMSDLNLAVDQVDINGADMILCKIGNRQVVFTTEKSTQLQDYELEQIVRQFKIDGKEFKSLDLRFEKPVVKF